LSDPGPLGLQEAIGELLQETGARLARAFRFAFADRAWPQRYGMAALVLLIPVAGYLALLGWQRRVYEAIRRGERQLPRLALRGDVRLGLPTFVNLLLFFGVPLLAAGLASPRRVFQRGGPGFFVDTTATLLCVAIFVVFPELLRRALVAGDPLAVARPWASLVVVRRRPAAYIVTGLAMFAAYLVMALGGYASFGIGLVLLAPPCHVLAAHLMTEWQHDVEASAPAVSPGG
jgi:hypothetical protein